MYYDMCSSLEAIDHDDDDRYVSFYEARASTIKENQRFSGSSQSQMAEKMRISTTHYQNVLKANGKLKKKTVEDIAAAIGAPKESLQVSSAARFARMNPIYTNTRDALVLCRPRAGEFENQMPSEFICEAIRDGLSHNPELCEKLVDYFTDPSDNEEPTREEVAELENNILDLPVGSISDFERFYAQRDFVRSLTQSTREAIAGNLKALKAQRRMDTGTISRQAGIAENTVHRMLSAKSVSLHDIVAVSTVFGIQAANLMGPMIDLERKTVEIPIDDKSYLADLPQISRAFIGKYASCVKEREGDLPTPKSRAILLITPLLTAALETVCNHINDPDHPPTSLGSLMEEIETMLRLKASC